MSDQIDATQLRAESWRAILPVFWLPLLFYVELMAALRFAFAVENHLNIGIFCFCARCTPIALVVMFRASTRVRIAALALFASIDLVLELAALLFDDRSLPLEGILHELARAGLTYLWSVAIVGAVTHGLTSLLGVFVASREPTDVELMQGLHGRVADWLYFMTLICLCFLPSLPEWHPPVKRGEPQIDQGGPLFVEIGNAIVASVAFGIPLSGLFVLGRRSTWRFRLFVIALLLVAGVGVAGYLFVAFETKIEAERVWIYPGIVLYSIILALHAIPFWLLLRWAGYRLYSPRKWIYSPKFDHASSLPVAD